jgi:hypothetical protein
LNRDSCEGNFKHSNRNRWRETGLGKDRDWAMDKTAGYAGDRVSMAKPLVRYTGACARPANPAPP